MAYPPQLGPCPPRFTELKRKIAGSYPDFEQRATRAWKEILEELKTATAEIAKQGSAIVPQVDFSDLGTLSEADVANIRRRGCVVIRDVVDDQEALSWRENLREYVKANPVNGFPEQDKQFFQLYWTKPQVLARAHPNVLAASVWLNKLYHVKEGTNTASNDLDVDLDAPLSYADRFRMRHPGVQWDAHPPHIDGGAIERWEDDEPALKIFSKAIGATMIRMISPDALTRKALCISGKISEAAPKQGTLQVFPNVVLASAYIILRPFFSPVENPDGDPLDVSNWKFDISSSDFPGIYSIGTAFTGPRPNPQTHPHLRLEKTMVSVPKVNPGDMVFWHCDVVHSVEVEHTGNNDSCVMYIPAMPYTSQNAAYVSRQKQHFIKGIPPPDFPQWAGEGDFKGRGVPEDIEGPKARMAMGLVHVA